MIKKSDYIVAILFAFAVLGAYSIYQPFLLSMIVALLLTMATANLHHTITAKIDSDHLSAAILTIILFIILFVPIIYIATIGVQALSELDVDIVKQITHKIITATEDIQILGTWTAEYLHSEQILDSIKTSTVAITKAGTQGISFIKNVFFVIVFYYVLNRYADKLFLLITSFLPMNMNEGNKILKEISSTMEIVFYSIIVTAIFEGLLFGIVVSFFGYNGLLFGMIYGFASLIPFVGGLIVWLPLSLHLWATDNTNAAIALSLYSIIVISIIADTFIKPMIIRYIKDDVLHSSTRINELIIFFSIVAGMSSYGFWGMILGPAITSFLIAMSKVYIELYGKETIG